MDLHACFAPTYALARGGFLQRAEREGARLHSVLHPQRGREGEELAIDVADLTQPDDRRVVVLASGTHGVEGLLGSGAQAAALDAGLAAALPAGVGLVLVHAHNPHGFSHVRRVNEDNVDLNRNFANFDGELEVNPDYAEVHPALVPADWDGPARAEADAWIAKYKQERGPRAFQAACCRGQHDHPDGLFYGGREPSWTRRALERGVPAWLGRFEHAALIDLHSGLGPSGVGELIFAHAPEGEEHRRLVEWHGAGEVTSVLAGDSVSPPVRGTIDVAYRQALGPERFTGVVVEFGTLERELVFGALRADNWLHAFGDPRGPSAPAIKRAIREAFYVDDDAWRASVWERVREIVLRTGAGLAG
jgi:hypothetical protein